MGRRMNKVGISPWWLLAFVCVTGSAQEPQTRDAVHCDRGKPIGAPQYPVDLFRRGIGGAVVLELSIDDCGRVIDATVKQPADHDAFNDAALESVRGATVSAAQRVDAESDKLLLPMDFSVGPPLKYQKLDWPATHRRPRYVLEAEPSGPKTADEASRAILSEPGKIWAPPYQGVRSRFVQVGEPGAREFWLFVYKDGRASLAAHYWPLMLEDEPIVNLSIICDDTEGACATATGTLMKGLPFAKARR